KKFRLVRVNAPIIIGGHLSAPKFGIDPGPAVAQTGIAALLSNVAAPLIALPFAAFDQAKDANCGGLLGQAKAQGAPVGR
ncbi:MAG: AsmA family protein, partial [Asticcacaulis sp.]|nr:AsmA family protein [Asticcacaulis sp.]